MNSLYKNYNHRSFESRAERLGLLRITALWAFTESAFGGILHALRIPFRGLFISSAAVLFISLIALFSKNHRDILKSTLIVMCIKAVVSPYSPLTAYFALSLQGLLGYLFFSTKRYYKLSALFLGMSALFFSGIQKIVVLTILFGNTLWESIDIFIRQITLEIFKLDQPEINYGYVLIAGYMILHVIAGIFIGIYAGRLPEKLDFYNKTLPDYPSQSYGEEIPRIKRKKKIWFLRPSGIFIFVLSAGVIVLTYLYPSLETNVAISVGLMILRSLVITFIWFFLLAPIAKKIFLKFVKKRKSEYLKEFEEIISLFPEFRKIINFCWKLSGDKKGIRRIQRFMSTSFYYILLKDEQKKVVE